MQRISSFSKMFCSVCVGVCAFLDFEPLPAADELQKERNQLGPAVLAKNFLQEGSGEEDWKIFYAA